MRSVIPEQIHEFKLKTSSFPVREEYLKSDLYSKFQVLSLGLVSNLGVMVEMRELLYLTNSGTYNFDLKPKFNPSINRIA